MRVVETKVLTYDELSETAKEKAIEQVRNEYYQYNEFAQWAVDDCWLLNPIQDEVKEFDLEDGILIGNSREKIYFDTGRGRYLDCAEAMEVKDEDLFLTWLGIPQDLRENLTYNIFTPPYRNSDTKIEFEWLTDEPMAEFNDVLDSAESKFDDHISQCLTSISESIDYRFTDEAIIEDIQANEMEFEEDGTKY